MRALLLLLAATLGFSVAYVLPEKSGEEDGLSMGNATNKHHWWRIMKPEEETHFRRKRHDKYGSLKYNTIRRPRPQLSRFRKTTRPASKLTKFRTTIRPPVWMIPKPLRWG